MTLQEKAARVLACLKARYPERTAHLAARNAWEFLVATVLAAQCTDAQVNKVLPELFRRWPGAAELADASLSDVEEVIRSTGFYRNKARHLIGAGKRVRDVFNSEPPKTLAELITLPGVARKTANVVLFEGYGINEGIAVDTHVKRIANRLGLTSSTDPVRIEQDLLPLFPREEWGGVNHRMVWFGRHICDARRPLCDQCEMSSFCDTQSGLPPRTPRLPAV